MKHLSLQSPAKINIYLKVLGKRPDGFHEIKTIFQRINLYDTITFLPNPTGKITIQCDHPDVPIGPKNLVHKVAMELQQRYSISQGVTIKINKKIPVAAGLAGGSTNAATALIGLNKLWNLQLSENKLVRIGKKIGSDVAFFLYDISWGLGTERGDRIKKLEISQKYWQIIVVPRVKMYSWKVYGAMNLALTKKRDNAKLLIRNLKSHNILRISELFENDLEIPAFLLCPKLEKLKQKLKSLTSLGVMLSGSGPSIFGLTNDKQEAEHIAATMRKRYSQVFVVETL